VGLRVRRMRHRRLAPEVRRGMVVGALAAAASTLASQGLIAALDREGSIRPLAAYRVGLAGAILIKLRRDG